MPTMVVESSVYVIYYTMSAVDLEAHSLRAVPSIGVERST